jgi:hypothetical protein
MEHSTYFKHKENLILQTIDGCYDGVEVWKEFPVRGCFTIEYESLSGDQFNELATTVIVLLEPGKFPHPGDRLKRGNQLYDIGLVEIKKSVGGKIEFYRCACGKRN